MQLADLGADVIKIEDPAVGGDVGRAVPPYQENGSSLFFESFNRNKRSIALDLRQPGRPCRLRGSRTRIRRRLLEPSRRRPREAGLRYEDLKHVNERIVCVSLSGFGTTGPRAAEGAYDATVQGLAGWMAVTGGPTEPPTKSGLSLVDFSAGYLATVAILGGVWQARRDGVGCDADLSLFETALGLLTYMATWSASRGWEPRRNAELEPPNARAVPGLRGGERMARRRLPEGDALARSLRRPRGDCSRRRRALRGARGARREP